MKDPPFGPREKTKAKERARQVHAIKAAHFSRKPPLPRFPKKYGPRRHVGDDDDEAFAPSGDFDFDDDDDDEYDVDDDEYVDREEEVEEYEDDEDYYDDKQDGGEGGFGNDNRRGTGEGEGEGERSGVLRSPR